MAKLTVGDKLPNFTFDTPYQKGLSMYEELKKAPKTALVFLRYYGCPFCQFDMHSYEVSYDQITASGYQFFVVLQSDPDKLKKTLAGHPLPFPIICDPQMKLYKELEIPDGTGMTLAGPNTMTKAAAVKAAGYQHGDYEGIETQLPATFAVDQSGTVTYVHYAEFIDDSATDKQLIDLLA